MIEIPKSRVKLQRAGVMRLSDSVADCEENATRILMGLLADIPHEEVHLVLVDGRSNVIGTVKVAQGGLHGCSLTARDVLRPVVASGAAAFIMGHNHPSGDPTPSPDDLEMTKHIRKCADLIGTPMLDHIVVCPTSKRSASICNKLEGSS